MKKGLLLMALMLIMPMLLVGCQEEGTEGLAYVIGYEKEYNHVILTDKITDPNVVIPKRSPEGDKITEIGADNVPDLHRYNSIMLKEKPIIKSIKIPNSVTAIGSCSFYGCSSLTKINIPNSVTTIGSQAFSGCVSLQSLKIPNSVTSIGSNAFFKCDKLLQEKNGVMFVDGWVVGCNSNVISVDISNARGVAMAAFENCRGLTSVVLPEKIKVVDNCVFQNCTGLTSVTISDSVTNINWAAFQGCTALTDVYFTGSEQEWAAITIDGGNEALTNATLHYNYVPEK